MKREVWKAIDGYTGLYEVSNLGRVRSVDRTVDKDGVNKRIKGKVLRGYISNKGYPCVDLYKASTRKKFLVHRIVAAAFVPNPDGLEIVNHIDENPLNPAAGNLEWCSCSYNNTFGKMAHITRNRKRVKQYLNGRLIGEFESQSDAARYLGVTSSSRISESCRSGKPAYGYDWRFA